MKKIFVFLGILIVLGAGVLLFVQHTSATKEVATEFTFEPLSRGNIQNLVSYGLHSIPVVKIRTIFIIFLFLQHH